MAKDRVIGYHYNEEIKDALDEVAAVLKTNNKTLAIDHAIRFTAQGFRLVSAYKIVDTADLPTLVGQMETILDGMTGQQLLALQQALVGRLGDREAKRIQANYGEYLSKPSTELIYSNGATKPADMVKREDERRTS